MACSAQIDDYALLPGNCLAIACGQVSLLSAAVAALKEARFGCMAALL